MELIKKIPKGLASMGSIRPRYVFVSLNLFTMINTGNMATAKGIIMVTRTRVKRNLPPGNL